MSVGFEITSPDLVRLRQRLENLQLLADNRLMRKLAATGEAQTRRRIESEKTSPDGTPWAAWSPGYAETRHGGQSLLEGEGSLLDSINAFVDDQTAGVFAPVAHAAIQQIGGTPEMPPGPAAIPAREFLGLSEENAQELLAVVDDHVDQLLFGD